MNEITCIGIRTIAPEENCPRLGLEFGSGLGLVLGLGAIFLGSNCPRTVNILLKHFFLLPG